MTPTEIRLQKKSRLLVVAFEDVEFRFSFEYLRVHSPSAEVVGHGPGQDGGHGCPGNALGLDARDKI